MIDIIGKKPQKLYFDTVIKNKNFAHFYILEGDSGIGKKTFADYIAMAVHCESENAPCGICGSCKKHLSGNHPDYIEIKNDDPEKKQISVETVRKFTQDLYIKPLISDNKIYVLTDRVPLGREGQNAFLKVLEEPPSYALILFLVNNADVLLPTVRSRGIVCHIDGCTKAETENYILRNFPESSSKAQFIAAFSGGNLGLAASLAGENDFLGKRSQLFDMLSIIAVKRSAICDIMSFFSLNKDDVPRLLSLLISWLRDAMYIKTVGTKNLINSDYSDKLCDFASSVTAEKIMNTIRHAEQMASSFPKGGNAEIWIADLLVNLG